MRILKFPDPRLLQQCEPVVKFDKNLVHLLNSMWRTMKEANGVGLAANQVGILLDICVIDGPNDRINMVNPYVASKSSAPAEIKEGCLSFPETFVMVPGRASWVLVKYQDEAGKHQSVLLEGLQAVAVQHEIDHLEGKVFVQHPSLPRTTRKSLERKWRL